MSKTYSTIPTRIGAAKLRNASILNTTVKIVKVAFGDGGGSEYEPTGEETSLKRQTYFTVPNYIKEEGSSPTWVEMEAVIPHNVGGWYLREFGCYDEEDDLIFIGNLPESYKPSGDAGVIKDLVFEMVYDAVAANVVSLKIDANVVIATRKFVEDQFKQHNQESNPHPLYLSITTYEKDALSFKQEWSKSANYSIGHEVVRNDLRYIARTASGPDNGGAVTPGGSDWSIWEPVEINIGWGSKEAVSVIDSDSNPITWIPGALMGVARFISATIGSHPTRGQVIVTRYQQADGITDTNLLLMGTNGNIYKRRYSVSGWTSGWVELVGNDDKLPFLCVPIGAEIAFDTPPPTNDPRFRFVKLTADDAYNSSLLNNKVISGTAPNLVVKMTVNSALSPINGQQIEMLNTMMAIPTPGLTSGAIIQDAMRNLTGSLRSYYLSGNALATGVLSHSAFGSTPAKAGVGGVDPGANYFFDFDASRQVPTADRFQPFGVTRVFYKRVY
ncbi:TPA: phage tail protein [Vibrio cholerae]